MRMDVDTVDLFSESIFIADYSNSHSNQ
ncbi:hypothetical protein EMIT0111MI5_70100 [Burkholderia sp. IT-111MI5]